MRDFAKNFYLSKAWRAVRDYVFHEIDLGLCRRCGSPGAIVHHKEEITPKNIDDPEIALGIDNLETVCRDCHGVAHTTNAATGAGLMFDDEGNLVEIEALLMPTPR